MAVEKDYGFETEDGTKTLAELFDGRSQLLVYHFMFGPTVDGWPDAGCPGCSYTADSLDGAVVHLPPRGVTFVAVSRAPLENLQAYRRRMGWGFPWVSAAGQRLQPRLLPCSRRRSEKPAPASTSARRSTRRRSTSARGAPRPQRLRARGRRRLPHLLVLRPRHRCPQRHLAAARPHPEGPRRRPAGLAAPTRRIRRDD